MPLWALVERGRAWVELYRTVVIAERKADNEIKRREERRARMQRMLSGKR